MSNASKTIILSPFKLGLRIEIPQLSSIDDQIKKAERQEHIVQKIFFGHIFFINSQHKVLFPRQPINIGHHLEQHDSSLISFLEIIEQKIREWLVSSQTSENEPHFNIPTAAIGAFIIALPITFSSSFISSSRLKTLYQDLNVVSDQNPSKTLPGFKIQVLTVDVNRHVLVIYNHQNKAIREWIENPITTSTLFDVCKQIFTSHPTTDSFSEKTPTKNLTIDDIKTRTIQDQESVSNVFVDFRKNLLSYYNNDKFQNKNFIDHPNITHLINSNYMFVKNHLFHLEALFDLSTEVGEQFRNIISEIYHIDEYEINDLIEKENAKKDEFNNFKHIFSNATQTEYNSLVSQSFSNIRDEIGSFFIEDFERLFYSDHNDIKEIAYSHPHAMKNLYEEFKNQKLKSKSDIINKIIDIDKRKSNWYYILKEFFTEKEKKSFDFLMSDFNHWLKNKSSSSDFSEYFDNNYASIKDVIKKYEFIPKFGWANQDETEFFTQPLLISYDSYDSLSFETFSRCISVYLYTIASPRFNNVLREGQTYIESLMGEGINSQNINNVTYTETLLDVFRDDRFLLDKLDSDLMLFRGDANSLEWYFDKAEGNFLIDKAFFSTSTNLRVARNFIEKDSKASLYFIYVPKFAATDKNKPKLLVVGDLATPDYRSEKEVLIPPGGLFYILNIESMRNITDSKFFSNDIQRLLEKYEGYIHHLLYMGDMMNEATDKLHEAKHFLKQLNQQKNESTFSNISFKSFIHQKQHSSKHEEKLPIENDMSLVKKMIQHPQLATISNSAKQVLKLLKIK